MPNQNMGLLGRVAGLRNGVGGSPGLNPTQSLWGGGTPNNGWTPGVAGTGGGGMGQPTMGTSPRDAWRQGDPLGGGGQALGGSTGSGGGAANPWGPMISPFPVPGGSGGIPGTMPNNASMTAAMPRARGYRVS